MISIKRFKTCKDALAKFSVKLKDLTYIVTLTDKTSGYPSDAMYPYKGRVGYLKDGKYISLSLDIPDNKEVYVILMALAITAYQRHLALGDQDNLVLKSLEDVY